MFQNWDKELKKSKTKKNRNFLIESANEIVGWFLVQEFQDITCVQKCEGSQWVCVEICMEQSHISWKHSGYNVFKRVPLSNPMY